VDGGSAVTGMIAYNRHYSLSNETTERKKHIYLAYNKNERERERELEGGERERDKNNLFAIKSML